ncbi:HNH endonuclease [Curvivirga sp.]|uniref:HNH endonuclease n=1 Tax=Curvivirga sp. TaxID=2856848 RepID=UPI003B5C3A0C
MSVALQASPALVLNADFRPLSYFPLSLWSWQEAVKAVLTDRVNIVAEYSTEIHSPSFTMQLPSVISLKDYVKPAHTPAFTRFNVFLRDKLTCQYCGDYFPAHQLTFDHVIPRRQGGRTTWENIVASCSPCNSKKGGLTPKEAHMPLLRTPRAPDSWELQEAGRAFPPNFLHESWADFLYWDAELHQ